MALREERSCPEHGHEHSHDRTPVHGGEPRSRVGRGRRRGLAGRHRRGHCAPGGSACRSRRTSASSRAFIASARADLPPTWAWAIRRHPNVISLKATRSLGVQDDEVAADVSLTVRTDSVDGGGCRPRSTGRGCIVAALDFGLDFAHPNFLRPDGTTRLMTLGSRAPSTIPRIPTASAMAANIPARRSTRRCAPPIPTRRWATIPPSATPATAATAPTPWTSQPAAAALPAPGQARRATPISSSSTCRRRASTPSATSAIRCASWRRSTTSTRSRAAIPGW